MKINRFITCFFCLFGLWLGVGLRAHAQTDTVTYVYTDPQGTPLAKADASGNVIARYDYTPYGNAVTSLGSPPNGPGYTGHVNDPETGLVYMQARYYQPFGRFLGPDPAEPKPGNIYGFNRYAYTDNNPINRIDPDGENAQLVWTAPNQAKLIIPYIVGLSGGAHMTFTTAQINEAVSNKLSGSVMINGANIKITAQAVEANGSNTTGVTNFLNVIPTTQGLNKNGVSETNGIGGNRVTIGATGAQAATPNTVAHEFGHVAGAGDQHLGGIDVHGVLLPETKDAPGWSGIMHSLQGGPANQQTLREIIQAPTNTNTCTQGVHAANGGC